VRAAEPLEMVVAEAADETPGYASDFICEKITRSGKEQSQVK